MENVSEITYAYLAGLFDGEGTVTLMRKNSSDKFKAPTLSMTSTTLCLLELCKSIFGGNIYNQKTYKEHHKQAWVWSVRYNAAISAAEKLIPYILEPSKRYRLNLLLTHYKQVTVRNGQYTHEQLQKKLAFEHEFFHPSNSIVLSEP